MADYNAKYPPPGGLKRSFSQSEGAQSPPLSQSTPQQRTFGTAAQHHGHLHDGAPGKENIGFAGQNVGMPAPERQNYGQPIYPRDATMMPAPPSPQTSFDRQGQPQVNGGQGSYPLNQGPSQSSQSPSSYTPIQQPGSVPRARHSSGGGGSEGEGEKSTRLNKACDNCSKRKVKCQQQRPCHPCVSVGIECTQTRESKRRGPANKIAEAVKAEQAKKQNVHGEFQGYSSVLHPTSPNQIAAASLANLAYQPAHQTNMSSLVAPVANMSSSAPSGAELICPEPVLQLCINDFFTYIHPLAPFPHEPSFQEAFNKRKDREDPSFLALVASMIATLVASFPRKPMLHLKAHGLGHLYASSVRMIDRCYEIAEHARGQKRYSLQPKTLEDGITSYFLALAAGYTLQWEHCRFFFSETLSIARIVGSRIEHGGQVQVVNHVEQQIYRRLFWIMIVAIRSLEQINSGYSELVIPPPVGKEKYPLLPAAIDDEYIYPDVIHNQPHGSVSRLTGFVFNCSIYNALTPLATMDLLYGEGVVLDWPKQKLILQNCLYNVKSILQDVPRELRLKPGDEPGHFQPTSQGNNNHMGHLSAEMYERLLLQYEVQKANLFVSQLASKSYIVEKYWTMLSKHLAAGSANISDELDESDVALRGLMQPSERHDEIDIEGERESIVKDLLGVLQSISRENMEPNGGSFVNKIRQVASTLVGALQQNGQQDTESQKALQTFVGHLMALERSGPSYEATDHSEETELHEWASLREYQESFLRSGGFSRQ